MVMWGWIFGWILGWIRHLAAFDIWMGFSFGLVGDLVRLGQALD